MKKFMKIFQSILGISLVLFFVACSSDSSSPVGGDSSSSSEESITTVKSCVIDVSYFDGSADLSMCVENFPQSECAAMNEEEDEESSLVSEMIAGSCSALLFSDETKFDSDGYTWYVNEGHYGVTTQENEDIPTENLPPVTNSYTESISGAGVVTTDGIAISVPDGAATTPQEVKIDTRASDDGFDIYEMSGLRNLLTHTLEISLAMPDGVDSSNLKVNYIIKDGCYSKSIDRMLDCNVLLDGTVDGKNFKVTLPIAIESQSLRSSSRLNTAADNPMGAWMSAPDAQRVHLLLSPYEKKSEHFIVHAPSSTPSTTLKDNIDNEIAPALEYSYSLLAKDYNLSTVPNPIHVYLASPDYFNGLTSKVAALAVVLPFMNAYVNVRLDAVSTMSKDELWATLGHELFHVVQKEYLPTLSTEKYMSEATAVWFEHKANKNVDWIDDLQQAYTSFQNYGLDDSYFSKDVAWVPGGYAIDTRARLGYGASTFLRYMSVVSGDSIISGIFENLKNGKSAIESLDNALKIYATGYDLGTLWKEFALAYNTNFKHSQYGDLKMADWPQPVANETIVVSDTPSYTKNFKMLPYSAQYVVVKNSDKLNAYDVKITLKNRNLYTGDERLSAHMFDSALNEITSLNFDSYPFALKLENYDFNDPELRKLSLRRILFINSGSQSANVELDIESNLNKAIHLKFDRFYNDDRGSSNTLIFPKVKEISSQNGGELTFTDSNGDVRTLSLSSSIESNLGVTSKEDEEVGKLTINIKYNCKNLTRSSGLCTSATSFRMNLYGAHDLHGDDTSPFYTKDEFNDIICYEGMEKNFEFQLYSKDMKILGNEGDIVIGGVIMSPTEFQSGPVIKYSWSKN